MRFAIIAICLSTGILAGAVNTTLAINDLMQDLGNTMLRMLPAAYSEDPDQVLLLENLVRLEYLLSEAEPHFEQADETAQVPLSLLKERLADARAWGTRGNMVMLQNTVTESFALCATCHVKDRVSRKAFESTQTKALENYLAVEYHFLTRDYTAAMSSMQDYFETGERSQTRDSLVLQKILTVGVEVRRDLEFSMMQLSAAMKYLKDGDYNAQRVSAWITVLSRIRADRNMLQSPIGKSLAELDSFLGVEWPEIRALLSVSEQEAYWVVVRGELHRLLMEDKNEKNLPQIYYWLAVTDRELQYRFYGSLSRAYLETCVTEFPQHPFASRCLNEYELLVLISFSGSSGTYVPSEVNERIQAMRSLIKTSQ